ncbi:MAG: hypothetical protein U1F11_14825 [Steroidobacteraceae bacterium]
MSRASCSVRSAGRSLPARCSAARSRRLPQWLAGAVALGAVAAAQALALLRSTPG